MGERAPEPEDHPADAYWNQIRQTAIDAWNRRDKPFSEELQQHPITPPPELGQEWREQLFSHLDPAATVAVHELSCLAAQWGTDQELEACLGWLVLNGYGELYHKLRAARRPMTEQKSTSMMINCHWDGPPPSPHASVNDWFEQEGSKGVLYGLRISALPSRGGNRSPKPPSLKEEALADFDWMVGRTLGRPEFDERSERIRRALESINDEE